MSQAQAVAETDRLPWLADEAPPERRGRRGVAFLAVVGALLVAAAAYWIGSNAIERPVSTQPAPQPGNAVPIEQPPAAVPEQLPAQPQVNLEAAPEVAPVPAPQVTIARPQVRHRLVARPHPATKAHESASATEQTTAGVDTTDESTEPATKPLKAWPATTSHGAEGRIVRIGAFGSRQQAKVGWRYMVRSYPAVAHLPATVVGDRNSNGSHFYRFQIGTTSQAHSEVLCQRMERIQFSCAVVGLPGKPKGVER
jgi:outer membrane biosynthesis protein TonB